MSGANHRARSTSTRRAGSAEAEPILTRGVGGTIAGIALLAAAEYLVALTGLQLAGEEIGIGVFAAIAGLSLGGLLVGGLRLSPGIAIGAFFVALRVELAWPVALGIAVGNTAATVTSAWLLTRRFGFTRRLELVRNVFLLIFPGAVVAAALAALFGTGVSMVAGLSGPEEPWRYWLTWSGGDALGILLSAPAIISWIDRPRPNARVIEALVVGTLIALLFIFGDQAGRGGVVSSTDGGYLIAFSIFPLAVWPAMWFAPREVATLNLIIGVTCSTATLRNLGPFAVSGSGWDGLILLHSFLTFIVLTTLLLSAENAERRAAADRLTESEGRFRSLTELSNDWYWEQDERLRFTSFSRGFLAATGISPDEFIGHTRWELPQMDLADDHRVIQEARQAFRDTLVIYRRSDGERRYMVSSGEPVFDAAGRFRGYRGVGRDVTAQKRAEEETRTSQQRFEAIFRASPLPLAIARMPEGWVIDVNEAWVRTYGFLREAIIGHRVTEVDHWADLEERRQLVDLVAQHGVVRDFACRLKTATGEIREVLLSGDVIQLAGESVLLTTAVDVTARKRAEEAVRASHARFESLFRSSPLPVMIVRLSDLIYLDVNDAWVGLFGHSRDMAIGRTSREMGLWTSDAERDRLVKDLRKGRPVRDFEASLRKASGELVDVLLAAEPIEIDGAPCSITTIFDITERKRATSRIEELATRDPLTGLPNRLLLSDRLDHSITGARRANRMLAVMFIDLDGFKAVNDRFGHGMGDELLKVVGNRLSRLVRKGDTLARLGGDEFIVLLDAIKARDDAAQVAEKIIAEVSRPYEIDGLQLEIGATIGIAIFPDHGDESALLLRHADTAMYAAKAEGRGTYRFF